jgi:hypothetical protein
MFDQVSSQADFAVRLQLQKSHFRETLETQKRRPRWWILIVFADFVVDVSNISQ